MNARGFAILDAVDKVAAKHNVKPAEVALAWLIAQPGVTAPIASATKIAHVESFVTAVSLTLSSEDIATLNNAGK